MTRRLVQRFACGGALVLLLAPSSDAFGQGKRQEPELVQMMDLGRDYGQQVVPVFEGWEPNADGTRTLFFGYLNRNWKETLDVPIGPNNFFDPPPQDRGQPTHFEPRRQRGLFGFVVPKEFGETKLVWTITSNGKTERVVGSLHRDYQIDATTTTGGPNTPPKITSLGPDQTITLPQPATLEAVVTDDGFPRHTPPDPGIYVEWMKYQGPGKVIFGTTKPEVQNGKALTTATFSEPGVYQLIAVVDDGTRSPTGGTCCWTYGIATVTVKAAASASGQR